jgi:hypothetical protein
MTYDKKSPSEAHPSYGMAGFSRTTGGNFNLFGSSIRHNNTIALRIHRATKHRNLNTDWYHAGQELIEVRFSPTQFAELLTSMNVGDGVPCTIEHVGGEQAPPCPEYKQREQYHDEFADDLKQIAGGAQKLSERVRELMQQPKLTKAEREEVVSLIDRLIQDIGSNLPFVHKQFNEAVEKTVVEAKGEIDATVLTMVTKLGLEALREKVIGVSGDSAFPAIEHKL